MLWNYLLLPRLCTESPEQWPEKFRKMPLCSDSESRDSWMWSMAFSRLDGGLVPELSPLVSMCTSSPGEGSGRMQGDGCCDWTGRGHFSLGCGAWLEVMVSEQTQSEHVQYTLIHRFQPCDQVCASPEKPLPPTCVSPRGRGTRELLDQAGCAAGFSRTRPGFNRRATLL